MCSIDDADASGSMLMERSTRETWSTVCQRCAGDKPVIQILQIKHAYCRSCFLAHVNHKFRSTLGKSKMMRPSDVVLASFSGSSKSLALLHLLKAGLSDQSHKRFLFKVYVLYIDEGAVLGIPVKDRESNLKAVGHIVSSLGFSLHYASLSSVYSSNVSWCFPWREDCSLKLNDQAEERLIELFNNVSTLTAQEDLLRQLRKIILVNAAVDVGCGKIFLAETSTDLAIKILTDVSLGRGAQIHHDVSFCDDRLLAVKLLRPMRELSSKEVAFYSVYNKLFSVPIPSLCTKAAICDSIHRLSEQFVMNLMDEFPSTVSTVFRTGGKVGSALPSNKAQKVEQCVICQAAKEPHNVECSSIQATSFSRLISSLGPKEFDNASLKPSTSDIGDGKTCDQSRVLDTNCASAGNNSSNDDVWDKIKDSLCYGCCLILRDMKPTLHLPECVLKVSDETSLILSMERSIQEFLL